MLGFGCLALGHQVPTVINTDKAYSFLQWGTVSFFRLDNWGSADSFGVLGSSPLYPRYSGCRPSLATSQSPFDTSLFLAVLFLALLSQPVHKPALSPTQKQKPHLLFLSWNALTFTTVNSPHMNGTATAHSAYLLYKPAACSWHTTIKCNSYHISFWLLFTPATPALCLHSSSLPNSQWEKQPPQNRTDWS